MAKKSLGAARPPMPPSSHETLCSKRPPFFLQKRAARRLFRKTSPPVTDELTSELDSLKPQQLRKRSLTKN